MSDGPFAGKAFKGGFGIVTLILGIVFYVIAYFLLDIPEDQIIKEILLKIGDVLVIGVVLGYLTTVTQNLGVFKKELEVIKNLSNRYGFSYEILFPNMDSLMDTLPKSEVVKRYDSVINSFKPDVVFIAYDSFHQDHQVSYDAVFASLRNESGTSVILYEYPGIVSDVREHSFEPNYWIKMTEDELKDKLRACAMYEDHLPRYGLDGIKRLAKYRGFECGESYAEAFKIVKLVK
jgi:hypothetical protein